MPRPRQFALRGGTFLGRYEPSTIRRCLYTDLVFPQDLRDPSEVQTSLLSDVAH